MIIMRLLAFLHLKHPDNKLPFRASMQPTSQVRVGPRNLSLVGGSVLHSADLERPNEADEVCQGVLRGRGTSTIAEESVPR
jgi:hypothetical protein